MDECDAYDCIHCSQGLCNTSRKHVSKTGQCLTYTLDKGRMPPVRNLRDKATLQQKP